MKFTPTLPQQENFIPIVNMFFCLHKCCCLEEKQKKAWFYFINNLLFTQREFSFHPHLNPKQSKWPFVFSFANFVLKVSYILYISLYTLISPCTFGAFPSSTGRYFDSRVSSTLIFN